MRNMRHQPITSKATVAVDYLTVTATDQSARMEIFKRVDRIKNALALMGERVKPWGFRGYIGFQAAGLRWGTRLDSDICMISGLDAQAFWSILAPLGNNCSRVDLAVTAETTRCQPRLLRDYVRHATEYDRINTKRLNLIVQGNGEGKTLYVGSRKSDQFGRVYDKGAQQRDPLRIHRLWRYEVEFKDSRAKLVLGELLGANTPDTRAKLIGATVFTWFDHRGIPPIFRTYGDSAIPLELSARVTSDSQALSWLRKQVKPTVERLIEKDLKDEVLYALGLLDCKPET